MSSLELASPVKSQMNLRDSAQNETLHVHELGYRTKHAQHFQSLDLMSTLLMLMTDTFLDLP